MASKSKKPIKFYPEVDPKKEYARVAAWFLGPRGENGDRLVEAVKHSIEYHTKFRSENYNKEDPPYITQELKDTKEYGQEKTKFNEQLAILCERLTHSVPFFTPRYQAHMDWDLVLPGTVGYITAMLYNQNNVATEAGAVTSQLELEVGQDLCKLMGYDIVRENSDVQYWGHITAGGTIANIEAMWVARNLKYLPLAIQMLLNTNEKYAIARTLQIEVWPTKDKKEFSILSRDELFRLDPDTVLGFLNEIANACYGSPSQENRNKVTSDLTPFTLPYLGYVEFAKKHEIIMRSPKVLVPATRHYSWPKAATLLGLGEEATLGVKVDEYCRMDIKDLKAKIKHCKDNNYTILMVVAVAGSTAEGIADDLIEMLLLRHREHFEDMNYLIHVDAAWGGYVRSILPPFIPIRGLRMADVDDPYVPTLPLSRHAQRQFRAFPFADSITIDPHKAGFIPYPAGALCYRNGDFRYLINMGAPYLKSDEDLNVGTFGVEGSKPGAAPAACWLAHRTISLDSKGYGLVLGECMFTVKRYYCQWMMLPKKDDRFNISMIHKFPKFEKEPFKSMSDDEIKDYIRQNIIGKTNEEISSNEDTMHLLSEIGPDILINAFVFNYKKADGQWNTDVGKTNEFTGKLLDRFSMTKPADPITDIDILVMGNEYSSETYGEVILSRMANELGLKVPTEPYSLRMINSTILNPWPTTGDFLDSLTLAFKDGMEIIIDEMTGKSK